MAAAGATAWRRRVQQHGGGGYNSTGVTAWRRRVQQHGGGGCDSTGVTAWRRRVRQRSGGGGCDSMAAVETGNSEHQWDATKVPQQQGEHCWGERDEAECRAGSRDAAAATAAVSEAGTAATNSSGERLTMVNANMKAAVAAAAVKKIFKVSETELNEE
ncbi:hypothetical protein K438DRAFT_1792013 [Mycena galopus ATCC 62051]|nr:hypothetical protein K438DRAFT_1792013 [Mycena galopus ATCC 62051]